MTWITGRPNYGRMSPLLAAMLMLVCLTPACVTASTVHCKPRDCADLLCFRVTTTNSDPQIIYPEHDDPLPVSCDQTTLEGGWVVFQRRADGSVDFNRRWAEYKYGFGMYGDATELWLGNEHVHQILRQYAGGRARLRIEGYAFDASSAYFDACNFTLGDDNTRYKMSFSSVSGRGVAAATLSVHNNTRFSTVDNFDGDGHCVKAHSGGWWFMNCFEFFLNGQYDHMVPGFPSTTGITMNTFGHSLMGSKMMFRPMHDGCINPCHNGGVCVYQAARNQSLCRCPIGYCGRRCGVRNPCQNGGTCRPLEDGGGDGDGVGCECAAGYDGPICNSTDGRKERQVHKWVCAESRNRRTWRTIC